MSSSLHLTPNMVAARIKTPVAQWPGNCYAIATKLSRCGLVLDGRPVYGHYRGEVSDACGAFYNTWNSLGWVRHGWILRRNGNVVDPTRWYFEAVEPYIYEAPLNDEEYDEGGNIYLHETMRDPPAFRRRKLTYPVPRDCAMYARLREFMLQYITPRGQRISDGQMHWLATLPLPFLGELAYPLFKWIISVGGSAWIPIDNRRKILGDK